ncbi:2OG-Fe(II) oxygenase [Mucilaginibacter sp.]|uniref:2OG-Fe(II) oxygenase n=1 Tax=Mucilaginibacter sp. TaxID=1882438 RepID=UPI003D110519
MYEKGSFYKKHLDRFQNNSDRAYSIILYLNEGWKTADAGELRVYDVNNVSRDISPDGGKSIFFKSDELVHEVLPTNKTRMSVTGWLKTNKL